MEINEDWTSSRGGATMQTSPCRVFRIPISLIGHNPDKVHGGWLRNVNKANNVCRQKIIVPSDFGRSFSCNWLSHGWCLKRKRENDQNSHPTLSKIWQPQQGSWRTDTCREYVQQLLQTKYNCPPGLLLLYLVWLSISWVTAEKGKGYKWLVWQNEYLKTKKNVFQKRGGYPMPSNISHQ